MLICFECASKWTVYFTFWFANCSPFLVCRETANLDLLSLCWVVAMITKCHAVLQLLSWHWENFFIIVELWIFPGLEAMGFGMPWIKKSSIVPFNPLPGPGDLSRPVVGCSLLVCKQGTMCCFLSGNIKNKNWHIKIRPPNCCLWYVFTTLSVKVRWSHVYSIISHAMFRWQNLRTSESKWRRGWSGPVDRLTMRCLYSPR